MNALVPFVLCADDYGLAPGVSAGIRKLIGQARVSATSCLVVSPHWSAEAPRLHAMTEPVDVGLHLALTQLAPLGPMPRLAPSGRLPSPARIAVLAHLGLLDRGEIEREIGRQIDAFECAMGRPPDYVDGHHHVHQLPIVRAALLGQFGRRLPTHTFLRVCCEPLAAVWQRYVAPLHATILGLMGGRLRREAERAGIPINPRFAGVTNFDERVPYRDVFNRFIDGAPRGLAVMCHPGYPDAELGALDPVVEARADELAYLESAAFPHDILAVGMRVGRFRELAAPA
ncbi:MAG: ChbG/HpnK family deacetylase [Alphaproteobacteria bacterium]|nr:ChbG/HpnK family deacetylase [Alphaproteobacteria bacterium]